jgi:hypothetical protein
MQRLREADDAPRSRHGAKRFEANHSTCSEMPLSRGQDGWVTHHGIDGRCVRVLPTPRCKPCEWSTSSDVAGSARAPEVDPSAPAHEIRISANARYSLESSTALFRDDTGLAARALDATPPVAGRQAVGRGVNASSPGHSAGPLGGITPSQPVQGCCVDPPPRHVTIRHRHGVA